MASKKTIWSLALEIAGKDTGASQAIRTVKKQLEDLKGAADQLGKDWKDFTSNATKLALGVAGGVTAATAGVVAMANSFAEAGDNVAKTSGAIGIGIEAYQGLQHAMGQSGVSAEEFDSALKKFNQTVRLGAAGNAAARKQLEDIGLSAQKLAGMKPEQAMMRLSDYMKSLPDDAARTQVALTLFGKAAGPRMMGAMKQGSAGLQDLMDEAKALGIVMTDEQAHQSEAYIDAISRLKQSVTGMKNQFIGGAIGPLTKAFDHLKNAIVDQMPAIREIGKTFGQWLGDTVKRLPEIIAKIKEFGSWVKDTVTGVKDFVGGWKNLAKILAGLAIAPTFISGLKTVFSFGKFINTAWSALPKILLKISPAFTSIGAAILPIIGIIAVVAAVIYTVVRNFDNLKQYALDCIERIKSAFGGATGGMTTDWKKVGEVAKNVLGIIVSILEGVVLLAIKTVMNALTSGIQIVIGVFRVMGNVAKLLFWPMETIIKVIIGLFTGGLSGAVEAFQGQIGKLGGIFSGIFEGIKVIIGGTVDFWKNVFQDVFDFVKGIIDSLAEKFGGVFISIKEKIEGFVNFFKDKMAVIKDFFDGIGDKISGLFGKGRTIDVAAHAEGGIFTHRHIAEIAEKGAEAVVPLDKSPQSFAVWKQAGELGGYLETASKQSQAVSAAAPVAATTPPVKTPEPSPVMAAAAQRISSGDTVVNVEFKMTNNFSGGTPDSNTVSQISEAGQKAFEDFETRVKAAMENILQNQHRVSYA
ncbi:MAG: hypothetical protein LBG57_09180 [Treponema sp.]|jgi:phage-related protein|nr:hypothetical protein [Treponema sp.]